MLCEGALLVAVAQILSYVKFLELPNGGSLTPAMFPILFFAVRWGWKDGLMAGFIFGVLQFMFDGGFALGWQSIIGDYLVAFAVLGLAGIFQGRKWGIFAGTVVGCAARFLVHYVVGATIWGEYMPEEFLNMTMTTPWIYSLIYNGVYMLPNMILALVLGGLLYVPLTRLMMGADIQK
ncbi:MAG: proton-coupled thiamine transporter YuaJ [Clostridia bacterium]|nr:proton-coupled thiamine transporter YuaJ [Clostridia bacterium]